MNFSKTMKLIFLLLTVLVLLWLAVTDPRPDGQRRIHAYTVHGEDMREPIRCEFPEPLKHLTLIMHWYDTNDEMYADYIAYADPAEHEEIWGWSDCLWQPEDSWAACDIYVVKPQYVHADMNVDTIGHEVLHGSCGNFHD